MLHISFIIIFYEPELFCCNKCILVSSADLHIKHVLLHLSLLSFVFLTETLNLQLICLWFWAGLRTACSSQTLNTSCIVMLVYVFICWVSLLMSNINVSASLDYAYKKIKSSVASQDDVTSLIHKELWIWNEFFFYCHA